MIIAVITLSSKNLAWRNIQKKKRKTLQDFWNFLDSNGGYFI